MFSTRHDRIRLSQVLPLLLLSPLTFAANPRAKPVVMPFTTHYGTGSSSGWFSVPLSVGSTSVNLTLSTSLSHSWVIGSSVCDKANNKTACLEARGGVYDPSKSSSWSMGSSGVALSSELKSSPYENLQVGDLFTSPEFLSSGKTGTETFTLRSNTGVFELKNQALGVIEEKPPGANGWFAVQQMAWALYEAGNTASASVHMLVGNAAENPYKGTPDTRYGGNALIFGGYDAGAVDLNLTQQYRVKNVGKGKDVALGLEVERLVYRWTIGGNTDNDLLAKSSSAIIDTTTPYLWLPPSAVDMLLTVTGAVWNSSLDTYTHRYCFSDCSPVEETTTGAVLDFIFPNQKLTLSFRDYFKLETLFESYTAATPTRVLPVRKLKNEDDTIILGRAVMAGVHLWVDYNEKYFGLVRHNTSNYHQANIVNWSAADHPLITNTSIIAAPLKDDEDDRKNPESGSGSAGGTSRENGENMHGKGVSKAVIILAAVAAVAVVLLLVAGFYIFRRRQQRHKRHCTPMPPPTTIANDAISGNLNHAQELQNTGIVEADAKNYFQLEDTSPNPPQPCPSPNPLKSPLQSIASPVSPLSPGSPAPQTNPQMLSPLSPVYNPQQLTPHHTGTSQHSVNSAGGYVYVPPPPPPVPAPPGYASAYSPGPVVQAGGYVPPTNGAVEMPAAEWDRGMNQ